MAWPSVIHVHHQTIGFANRNSLIRFYQTLVQLENSTTTQQLTIQHADEVIAYCTCITNHNPRMISNNCPISQQTEQISEKWDNKFENTQGNTLPVQSGICKQNGSWHDSNLLWLELAHPSSLLSLKVWKLYRITSHACIINRKKPQLQTAHTGMTSGVWKWDLLLCMWEHTAKPNPLFILCVRGEDLACMPVRTIALKSLIIIWAEREALA